MATIIFQILYALTSLNIIQYVPMHNNTEPIVYQYFKMS